MSEVSENVETNAIDAATRARLTRLRNASVLTRTAFSTRRREDVEPEFTHPLTTAASQLVVLLALEPHQNATDLGRVLSVERETCSQALKELRDRGFATFEQAKSPGSPRFHSLTRTGVERAHALVN